MENVDCEYAHTVTIMILDEGDTTASFIDVPRACSQVDCRIVG